MCPCCSPKPHRILMRCTCCGLINPQYKDASSVIQNNISAQSPLVNQRKMDSVVPSQTQQHQYQHQSSQQSSHCACAQNSCRAVKFDVPIDSTAYDRSDWTQIYVSADFSNVYLYNTCAGGSVVEHSSDYTGGMRSFPDHTIFINQKCVF